MEDTKTTPAPAPAVNRGAYMRRLTRGLARAGLGARGPGVGRIQEGWLCTKTRRGSSTHSATAGARGEWHGDMILFARLAGGEEQVGKARAGRPQRSADTLANGWPFGLRRAMERQRGIVVVAVPTRFSRRARRRAKSRWGNRRGESERRARGTGCLHGGGGGATGRRTTTVIQALALLARTLVDLLDGAAG